MTTNKMILNIKSNVAYITFNNPEKHNAVSLDMWDSLEAVSYTHLTLPTSYAV